MDPTIGILYDLAQRAGRVNRHLAFALDGAVPSGNDQKIITTREGKRKLVRGDDVEGWKVDVVRLCRDAAVRAKWPNLPARCPLLISVTARFPTDLRRDVDNIQKILGDAIAAAFYVDDRDFEWHARRIVDPSRPAGIDVTIWQLDQ